METTPKDCGKHRPLGTFHRKITRLWNLWCLWAFRAKSALLTVRWSLWGIFEPQVNCSHLLTNTWMIPYVNCNRAAIMCKNCRSFLFCGTWECVVLFCGRTNEKKSCDCLSQCFPGEYLSAVCTCVMTFGYGVGIVSEQLPRRRHFWHISVIPSRQGNSTPGRIFHCPAAQGEWHTASALPIAGFVGIVPTQSCKNAWIHLTNRGQINTLTCACTQPQRGTTENSHCWADSGMIGAKKALHQHIQAYGMWTHWWAHTYGAGGFCCVAWEAGTALAFDQTPNHRAQHTEYSLENCFGCIILSHHWNGKKKGEWSSFFLFAAE